MYIYLLFQPDIHPDLQDYYNMGGYLTLMSACNTRCHPYNIWTSKPYIMAAGRL